MNEELEQKLMQALSQVSRDKIELSVNAKGQIQPTIKISSGDLTDPEQRKKALEAIDNIVTELRNKYTQLIGFI